MLFGRKSQSQTPKPASEPGQLKGSTADKKFVYPTKLIGIFSLLFSFFSVSNPLFTSLATATQVQNMYAGFAILQGDLPYNHFFADSGVLFYLLLAMGRILGNYLIYAVVEFFVVYASGCLLYRLVHHLGASDTAAQGLLSAFYLLLFALGLGGMIAAILALPFALAGLWFLAQYFASTISDEGFIGYGLYAAFAFLIHPWTALLWLAAFPILIAYNLKQGRYARGIYQFLGTCFGFLLIFYTVGYYIFVNQLPDQAMAQALTFWPDSHYGLAQHIFLVLFAFVALGGATGLFATLSSIAGPQAPLFWFRTLLVLTTGVMLLVKIAEQDLRPERFLLILPYMLLLSVPHILLVLERRAKTVTYGLHKSRLTQSSLWQYLLGNALLPLVVMGWAFFSFYQAQLVSHELAAEHLSFTTYLREATDAQARIYVWDRDASLYLQSQRLAASRMTSPVHLRVPKHRAQLLKDLEAGQADYILVNHEHPLLDEVAVLLANRYAPVSELSSSRFTLYHLQP